MNEHIPIEYIDSTENEQTTEAYQESALTLRQHIDRVEVPSRFDDGEFILGYGSEVSLYNQDLGNYGNKLTKYEWEVIDDPESPDSSGKAFSGNRHETTVRIAPSGMVEHAVVSEYIMREDGSGVASIPTVRINFRDGKISQAEFTDENTINGEVRVLDGNNAAVVAKEALDSILRVTSVIGERNSSETN